MLFRSAEDVGLEGAGVGVGEGAGVGVGVGAGDGVGVGEGAGVGDGVGVGVDLGFCGCPGSFIGGNPFSALFLLIVAGNCQPTPGTYIFLSVPFVKVAQSFPGTLDQSVLAIFIFTPFIEIFIKKRVFKPSNSIN